MKKVKTEEVKTERAKTERAKTERAKTDESIVVNIALINRHALRGINKLMDSCLGARI